MRAAPFVQHATNHHCCTVAIVALTRCFQKAVDVTPEMAKTLIDACKREGVEVIVAP